MGLYRYRPLPASHIRLLELHPSADATAPLRASVLTLPLLSSPTPPTTRGPDRGEPSSGEPAEPVGAATAVRFEALSYAWGDAATPRTLHVADGAAAVPITASLASALARTRRPDAPRALWVDAVCINQRDPAEKAAQVGLMDLIYSAAERVIVDLGEDGDGGDGGGGGGAGMVAVRAMERYWRAGLEKGADGSGFGRTLTPAETARVLGMEDEAGLGGFAPPPPGAPVAAAAADPVEGGEGGWRGAVGTPDLTADEQLAVLRFFERPWFRRIWVVQEFVLAREVVMLCERNEINWRHLFASCVVYEGIPMIVQAVCDGDLNRMAGMMSYLCMGWIRHLKALQQTESGRLFLDHLSSLSEGRMMRYYGRPSLAQLLHYLRLSQATLRRDRYFALLKISSDVDVKEHPELRPDYTAPDHEIVRRFARVLIQKEGAADGFMRAGLWRQMEPELPSWAEDATLDNSTLMELTLADCTHKAAGETEFIALTDPDSPNIITVKGYRADTIQELATSWQDVVAGGRQGFLATLEYLRRAFVLFLRVDLSTGNAGRTEPYPTGEDTNLAAALTLCTYRGTPNPTKGALAGAFALLRVLMFLPEGSQTLEHACNVMLESGFCTEELVAEVIEGAPDLMDQYTKELSAMMGMGLTPAVTSCGYFANAPLTARPGDQVWIVQGCRFPMLLRRNDDDGLCGEFRLIGACYVHGIMNGETLQRPGFEFESISIC